MRLRASLCVTVFALLTNGCDSDSSDGDTDAGGSGGAGGSPASGGAGGEGGAGASGGGGGELCADRQGGAFVTVANPEGSDDGEDEIRLWITASAYIDEAIEHNAMGTWRVSLFGEVLAETDCDATHPWHVDPAQAEWVDLTTEECDATVTYVTQNLQAWVDRPLPNWCPWGGKVVAVDDRR